MPDLSREPGATWTPIRSPCTVRNMCWHDQVLAILALASGAHDADSSQQEMGEVCGSGIP